MEDVRITNPLKKALIQPMMSVCGIIIAILPFIIPHHRLHPGRIRHRVRRRLPARGRVLEEGPGPVGGDEMGLAREEGGV